MWNPADQRWGFWPLLPLYPTAAVPRTLKSLIPVSGLELEQPVCTSPCRFGSRCRRCCALDAGESIAAGRGSFALVLLLWKLNMTGAHDRPPPLAVGQVFPLASARAFPDAEVVPRASGVSAATAPVMACVLARAPRCCSTMAFPIPTCAIGSRLGPLDLGVGRFQEVSCVHRPTGALLVTDALVGISSNLLRCLITTPHRFCFMPVNGVISRSTTRRRIVAADGRALCCLRPIYDPNHWRCRDC